MVAAGPAREVPSEAGTAGALILGLGNPILSDDAVGVRLAADVSANLLGREPLRGVRVVAEQAVGGLALLDVLPGHRRVIIIDAIQTLDGTPGAWYRFSAGSLRETSNLRNIHDTNLATALALGRAVGMDLPPDDEIHIIGVEVLDVRTFSDTCTPELEEAYPTLLEEVSAEVERLLGRP